jgi:hypothetical protein
LSPVILFGVVSINLALIAYTVGMVGVHRSRRATAFVLGAFAAAVAFDVIATGCMVAGSHRPWYSLHGVVGYLALLVMVVAVSRLWGLRRQGRDAEIPERGRLFLRVAYAVWLIAYSIGVALAMAR